jgi:outer membrane protein assembly factor BamB
MSCVWLAVVPIVPAVPTLLLLIAMVVLSCWTALLSLRNPGSWRRIGRIVWSQRWPLAVAALISVLVVYAWPAIVPAHRAVSDASGGIDWPTDRGGLRRWGRVPGHMGPTRPGRLWTFAAGTAFYSSPAVRGDRVYTVASRGDRGQIHCLDAASGALVWSAAPPGYRATFSSPVLAGDYLICGEGLHHARQARIVCLDLRSGHEGEIVWAWTTASHVECTPVVDNGRVYVGAGDDGYYCLALEPDSDGQPRVLWHREGHDFPDAETSLAVHQGRVYAGLGIGGQALCVLDGADGREIGRVPFPYPLFSPPSIHDGRLYVGMGVGDYVTPNRGAAGQVCCIDLDSLDIVWTWATPATVLGAIAVTEDRLVFGCADGAVYSLDLQGRNPRQLMTGAAVVASVAVADDCVYAVNSDGVLWAAELASLRPLWQQRLGRAARYVSSPVVAFGHVYVGTEHDGLQCIGTRVVAEATAWPGHLGGPGLAGHLDESLLPDRARLEWRFPSPSHDKVASRIVAPVAVARDLVLVPVAAGEQAGMVGLRASGGSVAWQQPIVQGVWTSAGIIDDRVYFASGRAGDRDRRIYCRHLADGRGVWDLPLDTNAASNIHVDEQGVVAGLAPSYLGAINGAGKVSWYYSVPGRDLRFSVSGDLIVLASAAPDSLSLLDRVTGTELWRVALDSAVTVRPVIMDDVIALSTAAGLEIRDLVDGQRLEYIGNAAARAEFRWDRQQFVVPTLRGLIIGDSQTRRRPRLISEADGAVNPLVAGNGLLFAHASRLMVAAASSSDSIPQPWFDLSATGGQAGPMVLHAGRVYVSADTSGLLCLGQEASP